MYARNSGLRMITSTSSSRSVWQLISGVMGGICGEDRLRCDRDSLGLRIVGGGEDSAAATGRLRSRDPDDGPGSKVIALMSTSSMLFGVLIGENIVALLVSVLVAMLSVSM